MAWCSIIQVSRLDDSRFRYEFQRTRLLQHETNADNGDPMKLLKLTVRNFRCYSTEFSVELDDLTGFVGRNDAGKSSIFDALDVFLNEAKLDSDDASKGSGSTDIRFTCEFGELPDTVVIDATHETSLTSEFLLNDRGNLEISKTYDAALKNPKLRSTSIRAVHPSSEGLDDLLGLKIAELKARARQREVDLSEVDERRSSEIRQAIRASFADMGLSIRELDIDQPGTKEIWTRLRQSMPALAIFKADRISTDQETEAQDPIKQAVRLAIEGQRERLDEVSDRVRSEVARVISATLDRLAEIDPDVGSQLNPIFGEPRWDGLYKIGLSDERGVPINKRGSGIRRSILLAFLQAQVDAEIALDRPVIYAVEEPEAAQHPDKQRILLRSLQELSEQRFSQVLLTTHTPMLARLMPTGSLRYVEVTEDGARRVRVGDESTNELVARTLGVLPDHDVRLFVGVEGANDIEFFKSMASVLNDHGVLTIDLESLEETGEVVFVPLGGSSLGLWRTRLGGLSRPELYFCDRDVAPPHPPKYQDFVDAINERDGCQAYSTSKLEMENYLHPQALKKVRTEVDVEFGPFDDVPEIVARVVHEASESETIWDELSYEKREKKVSKAKKWMNRDGVRAMTPELLEETDPDGEVLSWFRLIEERLTL